MPLGPRAAEIFSERYAPTLAIERHRCGEKVRGPWRMQRMRSTASPIAFRRYC
jgi:hypothetical protein